mmetsp:Transcript_11776/g.26274  ORF Transcript_11776/g.26274 Transcript_11776/m.26274 type:complete len:234 (+) Transcript_11776:114-815(+)
MDVARLRRVARRCSSSRLLVALAVILAAAGRRHLLQDEALSTSFVSSRSASLRRAQEEEPSPRTLLNARGKSPFLEGSTPRGTISGRGKRNHFQLLDRYIRRVDALVPEEMEHLVQPLTVEMDKAAETQVLKITFKRVTTTKPVPLDVSEEDVMEFFGAEQPVGISISRNAIYVRFDSKEACRTARVKGSQTGKRLADSRIRMQYFRDDPKIFEDKAEVPAEEEVASDVSVSG